MHIFISYRRSDSRSASLLLAQSLKQRLGPEAVYLDTLDVPAGAAWREDMVRRVRTSDVLLVVIGPRWAAAAADRSGRRVLDGAGEDVVRLELETALAHGVRVVPVLVEDAAMPARDALPLPFRPLAQLEARWLRHDSWERDVDALVEDARLDARAGAAAVRSPDGTFTGPALAVAQAATAATGGGSRPPPRSEVERMAAHLADGTMVIVLGPEANAAGDDGPWQQAAARLPDAGELASHLAQRFGIAAGGAELTRVCELVSLSEGRVDLARTLRELLLRPDRSPSCVHAFAARLPALLRAGGHEACPLVVSVNWDGALERAFADEHEPHDLAVFMAAGENAGRFVHVPWSDARDGAVPIAVPNEYVGLPIDEEGALWRTVIVKLHGGAADLGPGRSAPRDNFVVTEDDYIGYLTQSPVEALIPVQILNKLRDSHLLFLGYRPGDWAVRVFMQRVWGERRIDARSWAVGSGSDAVERCLWERRHVTVLDDELPAFIGELERALAAPAAQAGAR